MSFLVRVRAAAEADLGRAFLWYAQQAPEQVSRLLAEFEAVSKRIGTEPLASRSIGSGVRSAHLKVFPYQLWYRVREPLSEVEVLAVVHDRQDRAGFIDRLI
ncbi:MAG: type II toxin-antitoxin system RelE/ParE family toxin [Actinomycetia bacterium]|nr:type II toxin-antitoxin system RelE/ParE family toxin [Actinomycetes bacterium]